jgi:hypothetical protein
MDRSKVHTLRECLETIESMEKICVDKFKPKVCQNLQAYYYHYCHKTFYKEGISSEEITVQPKPP